MLQSLKILVCLFVSILTTHTASAQQFKWAKGGGTADLCTIGSAGVWNVEAAYYTCTDANGNVYALSELGWGAIYADTFYRGDSYGARANILLTSYTCDGQMRWAKLIASSGGACWPYGIKTDNLGHLYVAGFLSNGDLHIGYDTSITGLTFIHQNDGLIQFDTNGHFNWVQYVGDNTLATEYGEIGLADIAVDSSNNAHYMVMLKYGVPVTSTLTSHRGMYDVVYNPAGALLGAKRLQLDSTLDVMGATLDKSSNKVYAFGNRNSAFAGSYHPFVAAFDNIGNLIWKDTLSNPTYSGSAGFGAIVADGLSNIYLSAGGPRSVIYRGDTAIDRLSIIGDICFILKIDTNGNKEWIREYSGAGSSVNALVSLCLMPNHKLGAAGVFAGTVAGGGYSINTYSGEGQNPYFTVFDSSGEVTDLQQIHGNGFYDKANSISSDKVGNLYIGGQVADSTWGGTIPAYHSHGGNSDFFVMKYGVNCSCTAMPLASYSDTGSHTIGVTYTGTTAGADSIVWHFGDGGRATGTTATHSYTTVGTFHVCVTVYTGCGNDTHCSDFTVSCGGSPVSSFTHTGTTTLSTTYTGSTFAVDSVGWIFGDGYRHTGSTASHTYSSVGAYTVCAVAHSPCGNDTSCIYDTIWCFGPPVSAYTHSAFGSNTMTGTYTGTTTGVDSIVWNYGDGVTSLGTAGAHTYTATGIYYLCVTAYSHCGNSTRCYWDTVVCTGPPVASFFDTGTHTIGITYTGTTTAVDSIVWDYGDGTRGTGISAFHTYSVSGTYHVCVIAYSPCGSDSACNDIAITVPPTSELVVGQSKIRVYPNPTKDELCITGLNQNAHYRLLNLLGACLMEGTLAGNTVNKIAIDKWSVGVYILELNIGDKITPFKIIRQ